MANEEYSAAKNSADGKEIKLKHKLRLFRFCLYTLAASVISSAALHVFVYPAGFVPLGLEAVVTMLYKLFPNINAGYFNLLLNAPLFLYAFFKLNKKYLVFTLAFTLLSSLMLIVFERVGFPQYTMENDVGKKLLSAIFAGIMLGARTGLMLRIGASTGGADIIARIIQNRLPQVNIERIISFICVAFIGASYFVYKDFNCILLGIVQMFISERATSFLLRNNRQAIEVKIVTKHPDAIREDIVIQLRHSATVIQSKGLFSGDENYVVLCVLNLYQLAELYHILNKYRDTFVFFSPVQGVFGNFRRFKDEEVK